MDKQEALSRKVYPKKPVIRKLETISIARSKDLINWEYSPINPVLMYDNAEDKK